MSKADVVREALDQGFSVLEAAKRAGAYYSYAYSVAQRHRASQEASRARTGRGITIRGGDSTDPAPPRDRLSRRVLQAQVVEDRGHRVEVVEAKDGQYICRACRELVQYDTERAGWVHRT